MLTYTQQDALTTLAREAIVAARIDATLETREETRNHERNPEDRAARQALINRYHYDAEGTKKALFDYIESLCLDN